MDELKKDEIKMEEEQKEEGATPTPSQEENPGKNDDLTPEEFEKELDEMLNNPNPQNEPQPEENNEPSEPAKEELDENSNPMQNVEDDSAQKEVFDENQPDEGQPEPEKGISEKMLTQSQVNELVGKARKEGRESVMKDLLVRYGVNSEDELDSIFGRGQAYDDLDYDYQNQGKSFKDAMAENALLKSHIDESRWEDVKSILGYKGLEVNAENIANLLPTHQEWLGVNNNGQMMNQPNQILTEDMAQQMVDNQYQTSSNQMNAKKPGVLKKLGNEPEPSSRAKTEDEEAAEIYGYNAW